MVPIFDQRMSGFGLPLAMQGTVTSSPRATEYLGLGLKKG